ncbi:putative BOI-related E3 ubiquitin-protein ligase 3 [Apium graveolens]|uniref:putative BOI-related E3 ubiquitin-protein ligase 3 n=1 Tax=Apium graveolens TaxID=4045 RepID=UPI003D7A8A26
MAVEAQGRHMSLFSPQLIGNKIVMNGMDGNANVYGAPVGYGGVPLMSGTTTESFVPVYGSGITDSFPVKSHCAMKADSGLTCNLPVSRKRTRDEMNQPLLCFQNNQSFNTFLGDDISLQIQHQQLQIDHFIAQHTDKMRLELEQRRKRNSKRIISAVEEGIVQRLRAKEEEIQKITKLNYMLEDKVKSLCLENQIWRDLAQSNEATANALRSNLEQVLSHVQNDQFQRRNDCLIADDAESCCGSNYEEVNRSNEMKIVKNQVDDCETSGVNNNQGDNRNRLCRNCGKQESCVLLLPCRHLCLCTVCGSSLHTCPICKSTKNASVHVNMSSY